MGYALLRTKQPILNIFLCLIYNIELEWKAVWYHISKNFTLHKVLSECLLTSEHQNEVVRASTNIPVYPWGQGHTHKVEQCFPGFWLMGSKAGVYGGLCSLFSLFTTYLSSLSLQFHLPAWHPGHDSLYLWYSEPLGIWGIHVWKLVGKV